MGGNSSRRAEEMAQRDEERITVETIVVREESVAKAQVSSSFNVPIRRHSINRLMDFDSDVSAVKDLNKPLDNHKKGEEMNQELSSEVGWKHLAAPVSSCS